MSSIFVLVEDSDAEGEEKNLSAFSAYVSGGKRSHQHNGIVLSRPILRRILVILGVKQRYAHQLTETLYHILCAGQQEGSQHEDSPCTSPSEAPMRQILPDTIKLPRIIQMSDLLMLLVTSVPEVSRSMVSVPMIMACSRTPIVFLFGGTSGSGKTTLASLTATHFGISSVVAVDSVRDVLRGIADQQRQCPQLMASTYEAYKYNAVKSTREGGCTSTVGEHYGMTGNSSSSDNSFTSCVIEGFTRQSCCVLSTLEDAVLSMIQKGPHSVVVEGVNLLVPWMYDFHCRLEGMGVLCLPFVVHLSNPKKHLQRFAVRSKHMQLLPHANKYAKNFDSVRIIQKYFLSEAQKYKVPTIANSNIDRSLAFVHYCLTTSLQVVLSGKPLTNKGLSCFTIPLPSEGMKAYANEVRERIAAKQHTTSRWNSAPPRASTSTKCGAPDSRVPEMRTTHQVGASEFLMVQSQRELSAVDDSHTGSIDVRDDESIVLGS